MVTERVVSLAPSATATVTRLDAADTVVGLTRACEWPVDGSRPPAVGGWPNPDLDAVERLDPSVVLTCDPLQRGTAAALRDRGVAVAHAEPTRLVDVFSSVAAVGAAIGRPADGERLAADLRDRAERVRATVPDDPDERPVVYAEEWGDPPMAAGNWVPDAVAAAGGRCPFVPPGERSREVDAAAVERADPDHAVLHWCGTDQEPADTALADRGWAVDPTVHVLDDSLLNQPSPRLVEGIETLAELLHGVDAAGKASE
ncbi:helical backbone metal receptor [Halobaculum gomorrense]|uniref:Iron complex transport system substrate-binding protein n=1 Tax=Halobaculum gomorrense TaxID=43928 RepID=A0A1M5KRS7_9EURY|nr:helical backbone metal receptor [Halobaculum gomorrense]SHG55416.1 iron complex transport system substrate-binding protein [Halobaculum gomorrense]